MTLFINLLLGVFKILNLFNYLFYFRSRFDHMNQIADSTLMKNQITPIGFLNDGFPNQIPSYVEKGPTINSQKSCSISSQIISFFSIPKRYQISILTCIGLIISFSVRCNMGIVTASLKAKNGNATKNITVKFLFIFIF